MILVRMIGSKMKERSDPPPNCDSITENEGEQNIGKKYVLTVPKVYKVMIGTECFSNIGPILWNSLSEDAKNAETLASFKSEVKELAFDNCPCSICKTYIHQGVGYLD